MGVLEEYFISPVTVHTGYNPVNTVVYALLLIVSLFLVYKILVKMKIKLDKDLWLDLLPFVFLGGALRALQDINFFGFLGVYHVLFVTPLIYFIIFLLAVSSMLISKYAWKSFTRYVGAMLAAISVAFVAANARNPQALVMIIIVTYASYATLHVILKTFDVGLIKNFYNSQIVAAHLLDASAAFVAVSVMGGYQESGVFTSFLFSNLPGWFFIPLKAAVALSVLHFIDKDAKNEMKWILKFAVFVLGLGPGLHNLFSVLMGSSMI